MWTFLTGVAKGVLSAAFMVGKAAAGLAVVGVAKALGLPAAAAAPVVVASL